ncbi:MAG: crossover junction endodeoxyribonuclease RuvC [Bacteroidetes bacterium]|nr:crossover junction endodeoxyribonuclease RuvC [Bacteroidota bacterium]
MRIIGIDPGSVITGAGVIEIVNGTPGVLDFDALKMNSKMSMPARLKKIYDFCIAKIQKYNPEQLSVETAFFGKNIQSTLKLGQVRGVVMLSALNSGLGVSEYSPREIKKSVTGNGAASKTQVQNMVRRILSIKETRMLSDASDALAIALCHYYGSLNSKSLIVKKSPKKTDWKQFVENNPGKIFRRVK